VGTLYAMNIKKVLTGLRDERERINAAITAVERLANVKASSGSSMKRPGRPPGSKNKPKASSAALKFSPSGKPRCATWWTIHPLVDGC
jgi:hypothetical protein